MFDNGAFKFFLYSFTVDLTGLVFLKQLGTISTYLKPSGFLFFSFFFFFNLIINIC